MGMMTIQAEREEVCRPAFFISECEDRHTASRFLRTFSTLLSPFQHASLADRLNLLFQPTMSLETEKIDHEMTDHNGTNIASTGSPLSRQVTVALSPEQYERLFFQPSAPRKGDLAKRFGTIPHPISERNEIIANILYLRSQSNTPRPNRLPRPVHIHGPNPMRFPGRRRAVEFDRVEWGLLLLWRDCDESCGGCGVYFGKQ
jgi:hypothetical protein